MPSSLFKNNTNGITEKDVDELKRMVGGDPDATMQWMMRFAPGFAEFVNKNRNKTPEQIAADYGLDIGPLRRFM